MADTAATNGAESDHTTASSFIEDLLGFWPRLAERTAAQVGFAQTLLSMLPCTRGVFDPADREEAPVPAHEARQPTDVLTVLADHDVPEGANDQPAADEPDGTEAPPVDELAIPDYDSLAASQVVPRLTTMSTEELEAIGEYESAHRRRRTILNRVTQLLG